MAMDRNSIIARLAGGFAVKAAAIVAAFILAHAVLTEVTSALAPIMEALQ